MSNAPKDADAISEQLSRLIHPNNDESDSSKPINTVPFVNTLFRNLVVGCRVANGFPLRETGDSIHMFLRDLEEGDTNDTKEVLNDVSKHILNLIGAVMRQYKGETSGISSLQHDPSDTVSFEPIQETTDLMLEAADFFLDKAQGQDIDRQVSMLQEQLMKAGEEEKKHRGFQFSDKSLPKPQLKFEDRIDNSNAPFVPRLNFTLPQKQSIEDNFHPFMDEIQKFKQSYPSWLLSRVEETPFRPLENDYLRIPEDISIDALIDTLQSDQVREIAIDLEAHSLRSFQGFTCLMQLSTRNCDYIVDTLKVRSEMHKLNVVFTDPTKLKILHGCDSDIVWLQRDFSLYLVNVFDTGQAARALKYPSFGLAYLLQVFCNVHANKQFQLADWRIRPLPKELLQYAREDTHYLIEIADRLRNELIDYSTRRTGDSNHDTKPVKEEENVLQWAGEISDTPDLLKTVLDESNNLTMKIYQKPQFNENAWQEFARKCGLKLPNDIHINPQTDEQSTKQSNDTHMNYRKHTYGGNVLTSKQCRILACLFGWRDKAARAYDESVQYILPRRALLKLVLRAPSTSADILYICKSMSDFLTEHVEEVCQIIRSVNETDLSVDEIVTQALFNAPDPSFANDTKTAKDTQMVSKSARTAKTVNKTTKTAQTNIVGVEGTNTKGENNGANAITNITSSLSKPIQDTLEADVNVQPLTSNHTTPLILNSSTTQPNIHTIEGYMPSDAYDSLQNIRQEVNTKVDSLRPYEKKSSQEFFTALQKTKNIFQSSQQTFNESTRNSIIEELNDKCLPGITQTGVYQGNTCTSDSEIQDGNPDHTQELNGSSFTTTTADVKHSSDAKNCSGVKNDLAEKNLEQNEYPVETNETKLQKQDQSILPPSHIEGLPRSLSQAYSLSNNSKKRVRPSKQSKDTKVHKSAAVTASKSDPSITSTEDTLNFANAIGWLSDKDVQTHIGATSLSTTGVREAARSNGSKRGGRQVKSVYTAQAPGKSRGTTKKRSSNRGRK